MTQHDPGSPLRLGPFELLREFGRGGSAAVWHARHVDSGRRAAIKLLLEKRARTPTAHRDFLREVRATARLNHPNIVAVYDAGFIPKTPSLDLHGLSPEAPWMALEWVRGPTLAEAAGQIRQWSTVRSILTGLLEALAHAHALGLVHRDVKPANVLVSGPIERGVVKLADFGIARSRSAIAESGGSVSGTPRFMAPEQFLSPRLQGPWTDLYSLGCLAWSLTCGGPPFPDATTEEEILLAHTRSELESMEPRFRVPTEFPDWLSRLTGKSPSERFQWASDAANSLRAMSHDEWIEPTDDPQTDLAAEESTTLLLEETRPLMERELPPVDRSVSTLPIASDWPSVPAEVPEERARRTMSEAGLGLFGFRRIPLTGRRREREALWRVFGDVADDRHGRVVFLSGDAGVGKSRLAEWLAVRAHELGLADRLRIRHGSGAFSASGFVAAFTETLGAAGLSGDPLRAHVGDVVLRLAPADTRASLPSVDDLVDLLDPETDAPDWRRHDTIRRLLVSLSRSRPLIVWLDDVHRGVDSLRFLEFLLDFQPDLPVLFVGTLRPGDTGAAARAHVEELLRRPMVTRLEVGPLDRDAHRAFVERTLPLGDETVQQVAERTGGNPLFARQVLKGWVAGAALIRRDQRLHPTEAMVRDIPPTFDALWRQRTARITRDLSNDARHALMAAAVLGDFVSAEEWRSVCERLDVVIEDTLVDRLLADGLVVQTNDGWAFRHATFRAAVVDAARSEGWFEKIAIAADATLESSSGRPGVARRRANFLLAADDDRAADRLLDAARQEHAQGDDVSATELLETRADRLQPGEDRVLNDLMLAHLFIDRFELERADDVVASIASDRLGGAAAAKLLYVQIVRAYLDGRFDEGVVLARRGRESDWWDLGEYVVAAAAQAEGHCLYASGQLDRARRTMSEVLEAHRAADNTYGEGFSIYDLAHVAMARGDLDRARRRSREAMKLFGADDILAGRAYTLLLQAELARLGGRVEEAAGIVARVSHDPFMSRVAPFDLHRTGANIAVELGDVESLHEIIGRASDEPFRQAPLYRFFFDLLELVGDSMTTGQFDRDRFVTARGFVVRTGLSWPDVDSHLDRLMRQR